MFLGRNLKREALLGSPFLSRRTEGGGQKSVGFFQNGSVLPSADRGRRKNLSDSLNMALAGVWGTSGLPRLLVERRTPICDRRALGDKETLRQIDGELRMIPKIPWEVEATSHCHILNSSIAEILSRVAPCKDRPGFPHWMTAETKEFATLKSNLSRQLKSAKKDYRWGVLQICFSSWKHLPPVNKKCC